MQIKPSKEIFSKESDQGFLTRDEIGQEFCWDAYSLTLIWI